MKNIAVLLALAPVALAAMAHQGADNAGAITLKHQGGRTAKVASKARGASVRGFVRALAFQFRLRVCNAFPSGEKLTVMKGKDELTTEPLSYQNCADTTPELKSGDKIDFHLDGSEAGTFTITDLPQNDATLLLVMHRHDTASSTVSFESHVFANLANAQIAVIDAYTGDSKAVIKIQDHKEKPDEKAMPRQEELRYDSVVAVNPGDYECVLYSSDGAEKSSVRLVALEKESYLVLRTGVEDKAKPYPQELVVYPKSEEAKSSAAPFQLNTLLLAIIASGLYMQ